ncbi:hypothetical protein [Paraliomyxa miuraensis]|uniref:hypothetical protein n=1 Tax=Paraliomyxa miuraensis TaxID=376150 RepID=UPI00225AB85F|nr:hypothetical protein [Paraliomyxa miuraensis]MCX4241888.1 hypothetical protein [Paraliomyxa miuraensis]
MNAPRSIRPIVSQDLLAKGTSDGEVVALELRGTAELGAKDLLDDLFADAFDVSTRHRRVVVDLRRLEYMNSSSFKSMLTWLVRVRELPESQRPRIRFLSNPSFHWQRRSLHSLATMGGDLIEVEENPETP